MIGTGIVDLDAPPPSFDFGGAAHWQLLLLRGDRPVDRIELPSPGEVASPALFEALVSLRGEHDRGREHLIGELRERLGLRLPPVKPLEVSVVVCTHRRSRYLPDLLRSLRALDPAPFEVVIVDNDPGEEDCRASVEEAGFRYVLEPRRGLDNARNAGVRAARGEIVAFTDDDCVVSPHWLAPVAATFAGESVVAATGPAFPYVLDTPARVRMERQASLARGFRREVFDWQTISPLHAAALGVGANMAIRREALLAQGPEPFPPELDAGTESESGGDTYAIARLLAAGGRVVYDPSMFVFHQHRPDGATLHRAVLGYGIGLSAALTKLVVEDRELTAPRAWAWLVKQYLRTQRRRLAGRAERVETALAWDFLRGGFLGTGRWRRALRTQRGLAPTAPAPSAVENEAPAPAAPAAPVGAGECLISIVVPTYQREEALGGLLEALARQSAAAASFEVLVVDDEEEGRAGRIAADTAHPHPFPMRRIGSGGEGAAAARNSGARAATAPLLLFLDDDVVPDEWLVQRHLDWHREREEEAVLVGSYRPDPVSNGLATQVAALWWRDFFEALEEAPRLGFTGALTANMSIPRRVFERIGGFSERYARARREDWEWGLRARRAELEIAFDPGASARHRFALGTAQRLRDARREGFGDALIVADYPEALAALPLRDVRPLSSRQLLRRATLALWPERLERVAVRALDGLEWLRFREAWARLFRRAQAAAYVRGAREGGWDVREGPPASEPLAVELRSPAPIPPPAVVAPLVRATIEGAPVATVIPRDGVWSGSIPLQIADSIDPDLLPRLAPQKRSEGSEDGLTELIERTEVFHPGATAVAGFASDRPLVAIALSPVEDEELWLAEALIGLTAERVGVVFGGSPVGDNGPEPLFLHDAPSSDGSLLLAGLTPTYLVARRELLTPLAGRAGLDLVQAAVEAALAAGWVVGHRDVRGLSPATGPNPERARGEAFGRARRAEVDRAAGAERAALAASYANLGLVNLAWLALRRRGRPTLAQRRLATGILRGFFAPGQEPASPPSVVPHAPAPPVGTKQ